MEYKTAVVDECGTVLYWVEEIGRYEAEQLVKDHPEWSIKAILIEEAY